MRHCLNRLGNVLGLLPWAIFVLIASKSTVTSGLHNLEAFQDSGNPGYFLVKLALWVMAILIICQSLLELFRPQAADDA